MYNYKTYDYLTNTWVYGELEKIVNSDLSSKYYIVNENIRFECKKENICKLVPLRANGNALYDKDIIKIKLDSLELTFIIKLNTCNINFEYDDIMIYGLVLYDISNAQNCLISSNLNEKDITYVGNILESELN